MRAKASSVVAIATVMLLSTASMLSATQSRTRCPENCADLSCPIGQCESCATGYTLIRGGCYLYQRCSWPYTENCLHCSPTDASMCFECQQGYYLSSVSGKKPACLPGVSCQPGKASCALCAADSNLSPTNDCKKCAAGYLWEPVPSTTTCTQCLRGYTEVKDGSTSYCYRGVPCAPSVASTTPNCGACVERSNTVCQSCAYRYALNPHDLQCYSGEACPPTTNARCGACDSTGACAKCRTQYKDAPGCEACANGYTSPAGSAECYLGVVCVGNSDPNCGACDTTTPANCKTCVNGYTLLATDKRCYVSAKCWYTTVAGVPTQFCSDFAVALARPQLATLAVILAVVAALSF